MTTAIVMLHLQFILVLQVSTRAARCIDQCYFYYSLTPNNAGTSHNVFKGD